MNRTYVPYTGDISGYGYGPEHEFFLWDVAADSLNDAGGGIGGAVPTPRPRPTGIRGWGPNDETGGGSPYGGSATVEQSGRPNNPAQTERAIDVHRRGTADLTLGNIARAGMMMSNVAGALGPISMGASLLRNPDPYTGSVPATQWGRDLVKRGVPVRDVQRMERDTGGHGPGAGGPGHTGEGPNQGGAGGGPRGGQQQGGGKRGYADGGIAGWRSLMRPAAPAPAPTTLMERIAMYGRPEPRPPRRGVGPMDGPLIKKPIDDPTVIHRQPPSYADGGIVGAVRSSSPGRSDAVDAKAEAGTYVIPADVVSALGQGNTAAGVKWLDRAVEKLMQGDAGAFGFKRGDRVPIRVSGGEYAVPPTAVTALGRGSYENGARKLEALIAQIRQQAGRGMPAPQR